MKERGRGRKKVVSYWFTLNPKPLVIGMLSGIGAKAMEARNSNSSNDSNATGTRGGRKSRHVAKQPLTTSVRR
jgi:hypothetical protein